MTGHKYICSRVKLAKGKKKLWKRAPIKKTEKKGKLRGKVEVENISRPEFRDLKRGSQGIIHT